MSAISPDIHLETRADQRQPDVRAALRQLSFRRRLWRALAVLLFTTSGALALLCMVGALDYVRPWPLLWRAAIVIPIWLLSVLVFVRSLWQVARRPALAAAARELEQVAGIERNALVTLCEQLDGAAMVDSAPYMVARLSGQARGELAAVAETLSAPRGAALRGALALTFMLLVLLGWRVLFPAAFALEARRVWWLKNDEAARSVGAEAIGGQAGDGAGAVTLEEVRVRVVPPAYAALEESEAPGAEPVRALAGSRIEVLLRARGPVAGASLSFNGAAADMRSLGEGGFSGSFVATQSGAFEARLIADERLAPAPTVRAVEVYADAQPEVRITAPGGDQLLSAVPSAPVGVRWTARDDLGLAAVSLKYIKSRGEGDAAKFTSGEVSAGDFERANGREWRGLAALDLSRLGLQAGDTLVFWLEARDRNPGAGSRMGRSNSLAIAIRAPEAARLNLSDLLPNEIGRFLLSQRQIIIKTEKLHAERVRLARDELLKRANDIAADQREFKNSFDDYIHSEGAAEVAEANTGTDSESLAERVREAEDERTGTHLHGIPEPPAGTPASVREMVAAIRAMWDAEAALSSGDTTQALVHERKALAHLKRAQTAVRYIPPLVAQSKPVDLKRRYAGELAEIKTRLEKLARRPQAKEAAPLRAALADAFAALADLQSTLGVPASGRGSAVGRARERARQSADRLISTGGDHAATIAEATAQLRIVETELSRLELGGTADEYAARLSKPLALLAQAAANLFALAESNLRSGNNEAGALLPADDARAADYFRRLGGSAPR